MVLYELCRVNNTDFALVHFATETKVDYFPKDRRLTAEQVMNCAETFLNGGTDFVKPLEEVMSIVRNARLKDPDVVFITDGECKLPDNFISVIRKFKALPEMEWSRDIVEQYYRKHPEAKQIECIRATGISSSLVCTYWPGETGWGGSFDKVEAYFRANHGSSQRDCARATGLSPYTDCEAATGYRAYYIKRF